MGMFDYVNVEMTCPHCKGKINSFQSKCSNRTFDTIDPQYVSNFYGRCSSCFRWVEFERDSIAIERTCREVPFSKKEIEAMGFKLVEE